MKKDKKIKEAADYLRVSLNAAEEFLKKNKGIVVKNKISRMQLKNYIKKTAALRGGGKRI